VHPPFTCQTPTPQPTSSTGQFGFGYDALSRRTQLTRPNGVNTNYSYDSVSNLLSVLHQAGSTTLDGASYGYDYAGNRTSKANFLNGTTSNYGYDLIYELQQVTQGGSTTESYSYDAAGNRLSSLGVNPYSYNTSNELTSIPSGSYTYDANGNTLSDPSGKQYTWNFENQLTSVTVPGSGTTTYRYDPFGSRIYKSSPTWTGAFVYDGYDLIETVNSGGTIVARYAGTRTLDETLAELRSGGSSYYEADGLGSITSLSSSAGAIANTYTYDSFGNVTNFTGTLSNPFQYTAREFDQESALDYYRTRYYDPTTGRFLSEDPLRFKTNVNFYPYALSNPIRFNDPTGLSAADIGRIGGACQKCTDQLTQSGERLEGSGWWNGELNNAAAAIGWGNHYSGCDRQANLTASCLNFPSSPPGYDNSWTFTVESTHWGLHRVTVGRSNNPFDPVVICDSWKNTFTTVPSF